MLTQLSIQNLRNLSEASLEISEGLSVFTGLNGAGKTSALDAVHVLGTGKSFTTSQLSKVIRNDQPGLQVVGRMKYGGAESVIGISRLRTGGGETRLYPGCSVSDEYLVAVGGMIDLDLGGVRTTWGVPQ